ncbi:MAG: CvpA family protein [Bacteroidales bacterium]|nr:CvpA family protein [Bacteroidales bacterium]MDD4671432.1 CvpA family protein [Bacteroidales bacterium]MDY0347533.1 CvpA family protein [Tenuifilaceae bacterium]
MTILDIVLLVVFIFAGFNGYKKGLIAQAAGLIGLLLGIWGAIHFSDFTANLMVEQWSFSSPYLPLISFAITFVIILVGVYFIGKIAEGIVNLAFLGIINKLLGLVFGVLKTALIFSVILLLLGKLSSRVKVVPDNFGEDSFLYGPVERLAPSIFPYLNFEGIKDKVEDTFTPDKQEIDV